MCVACSVVCTHNRWKDTGITPFIPWEYIQVSAGNESINFQTYINCFVKVAKPQDFVNIDVIAVEEFALNVRNWWSHNPKYFSVGIVHIFWEGLKICEIFTLLLSYVVPIKSKVKISQNFVAFSEYMNFTRYLQGKHNFEIQNCKVKWQNNLEHRNTISKIISPNS